MRVPPLGGRRRAAAPLDLRRVEAVRLGRADAAEDDEAAVDGNRRVREDLRRASGGDAAPPRARFAFELERVHATECLSRVAAADHDAAAAADGGQSMRPPRRRQRAGRFELGPLEVIFGAEAERPGVVERLRRRPPTSEDDGNDSGRPLARSGRRGVALACGRPRLRVLARGARLCYRAGFVDAEYDHVVQSFHRPDPINAVAAEDEYGGVRAAVEESSAVRPAAHERRRCHLK
mmetsp:Transcript_28008/g.96830  ORF Transcript_28008/g.96830 Transcript_28008/m.96830 type:complete len:235 (-) Transcript_28008:2-706(-)